MLKFKIKYACIDWRIKMAKKILIVILVFSLMITLVGCGTTTKEFITSVENYQIFNDNNVYGIKTVSDFKKQIESLDEEGSKIITMITTMWSDEKLKEQDSFIQHLKQSEGFVYDNKKYYGELSVNVTICSSTDYSTKEDFTYIYLFSVDKDGIVIPEATTNYTGSSFDYQDITTDPLSIQDSMTVCLMLTKALKATYSE